MTITKSIQTITHINLERLEVLAKVLSQVLRKGDGIALSGPMGSGKTTFARMLIMHLAKQHGVHDIQQIPSPTYTMVQTYDLVKWTLWHYDFYRIKDPSELIELGWEDAITSGVWIAEWAELGEPYVTPAATLTIAFLNEDQDIHQRRWHCAGDQRFLDVMLDIHDDKRT